MISPIPDCGVEAYDEIMRFSDASSSDFSGSTPVGSDGSPSPSRQPSAMGGNETPDDHSRRHLRPEIRVSRPPTTRQQSTDYGSRCSHGGCGSSSAWVALNREETDCSSDYSESSCCGPQVLGRGKSKQTLRYQTGEASGAYSAGSGSRLKGAANTEGFPANGDDMLDDDWLGSDSEDEFGASNSSKMRQWKKVAKGKFEKMLLDCIVNTDEIAPDYEDIFVSRPVIDRLERTTSLSLKRQMAFSFGVLAKHKVTGAILYGPPGTGKSLLAKAVAKASGFNMICISTAEVWQKCHGDDERMVQAIFRLARKMYPCIVFVDEADAMLGQRKQGERRHLKSMINQFLIEWDGLSTDKKAPFVLLATNRPNDLDPAVIRRAPEHIYMGKPTMEERAGIIRILLKGEVLGRNVNPHWLAQMTQGYTGSDLKNVCVTAATICVGQQREDRSDRVLEQSHFSEALKGMRASRVKKRDEAEYNTFGGKVENNYGGAGNHGRGGEDSEDD